MEQAITLLIYFHALFGGIALIAGLISIIAKKGSKLHKKSGILFYYAMIITAISAMIVAILPNHESPFLFAIGIFSLYFTLTGKRALRFKDEIPSLKIDKWISRIMIVTGILMIFLPIILSKKLNIVLTVFGIIGIIFSSRDLFLFNNHEKLKKGWLKLHLGKMTGAYISATTAFIVVGNYLPSIYGWFVPGSIGAIYITYWIRKVNSIENLN